MKNNTEKKQSKNTVSVIAVIKKCAKCIIASATNRGDSSAVSNNFDLLGLQAKSVARHSS